MSHKKAIEPINKETIYNTRLFKQLDKSFVMTLHRERIDFCLSRLRINAKITAIVWNDSYSDWGHIPADQLWFTEEWDVDNPETKYHTFNYYI